MITDTRFYKGFEELIGLEGGYVNLPYDKGGPTKWGISQRAFPDLDIPNLTLQYAQEIYWNNYWHAIKLPLVNNEAIAFEIFECCVNTGLRTSAMIVQRGLNYLGYNLLIDGKVGPVTLKAINEYVYPDALLKVLNCLQFLKYLEIVENDATQKAFARGWLKRIKI
jgi:lysozyme family protein